MEAHLRAGGHLDDAGLDAVRADAEALAADVRAELATDPRVDPREIFDHVFAAPTPQLREQRAQLEAELAAAEETP